MGDMINLTDIGMHILNVVILFIVLRFLLYKPINKYMKAREERFAKQLEDIDQKAAEVEKLKKQQEAAIAAAEAQSAELIDRSSEMAETQAKEIIETAKKEADNIRVRARKDIEQEKAIAKQEMRQEIADMAIKIASKVLEREVTEEDNKKIVDDFFEKVG